MNKFYKSTNKSTNKLIEVILSNLFFFFFVAQICSPYVAGRTLYLELFIVICNPYFFFWLKSQKITQAALWLIAGLSILLILIQFVLVLKLLAISFTVLFLFYAHDKKIFYLKRYLLLSICIAILQFIFLFIDPNLSRLIGPQNISLALWGQYATPTFTNFYTVFWFPRVSGLSREAGFFASFLIVSIFYFYLNNRRNGFRLKSKISNLFLWTGYILSFSKMSVLILLLIIVEKVKLFLNKIPLTIITIAYVVGMMFFWEINKTFMFENITFLHRFASYPSLFDVELSQLLFGINNVNEIESIFAKELSYSFDTFAGFGGFLLDKGIIVIFVFLIILWITGVSSTGILILLLLTMNVQPDTNQNFVVMVYFIIYKFYRTERYLRKKC